MPCPRCELLPEVADVVYNTVYLEDGRRSMMEDRNASETELVI